MKTLKIFKKTLFFIVIFSGASLIAMEAQKNPQTEYTINFMWINSFFVVDQNYIFPAPNEKSLDEKFLRNIIEWAKVNPKCTVNIWYDSNLITSYAVENTDRSIENLLRSFQSTDINIAEITLRDIRDIPKVKDNPEVFSAEIPVYFRVDLLRPIIALYIFENNEANYFIYTDIDVKPLSEEALLDKETKEKLDTTGIVLPATLNPWIGNFENGFMMLSNKNAHLIDAIEWAIIALNLERARNALKGNFFPYAMEESELGPMKPLQEAVYYSYPAMLMYFDFLNGTTNELPILESKEPTAYRNYDKNRDGLTVFGLNFVPVPEMPESQKIPGFLWPKVGKAPTKKIPLPESFIVSHIDVTFFTSTYKDGLNIQQYSRLKWLCDKTSEFSKYFYSPTKCAFLESFGLINWKKQPYHERIMNIFTVLTSEKPDAFVAYAIALIFENINNPNEKMLATVCRLLTALINFQHGSSPKILEIAVQKFKQGIRSKNIYAQFAAINLMLAYIRMNNVNMDVFDTSDIDAIIGIVKNLKPSRHRPSEEMTAIANTKEIIKLLFSHQLVTQQLYDEVSVLH